MSFRKILETFQGDSDGFQEDQKALRGLNGSQKSFRGALEGLQSDKRF